jgi:myo-inositol-1(or 4)-monophosphatase
VELPPQDVSGAGLVVAAAPAIAEQLLAALRRFGGLDPILD